MFVKYINASIQLNSGFVRVGVQTHVCSLEMSQYCNKTKEGEWKNFVGCH